MTNAAHWFDLIDNQFRDLRAQLGREIDIAPAQRFQLEGIIAAAHADGIDLNELLMFCVRISSPSCEIRIDTERDMLLVDCWQQRAPVYPSTTD